MSAEVVGLAIKLIQADALEIVPMRPLMEAAIGLALAIDHPAYDCLFAALALREQCPFITADVKFLRKARGRGIEVMTLEEAALATR
jgi:predicted nucleic acid-binding protein